MKSWGTTELHRVILQRFPSQLKYIALRGFHAAVKGSGHEPIGVPKDGCQDRLYSKMKLRLARAEKCRPVTPSGRSAAHICSLLSSVGMLIASPLRSGESKKSKCIGPISHGALSSFSRKFIEIGCRTHSPYCLWFT